MILTPDPNLEVKFELYDKDIDSDDFLGRLVDSLSILHVLLNVHTYLKYTDIICTLLCQQSLITVMIIKKTFY